MCKQVPISLGEEAITKMIESTTMDVFLKASPFSSGQRSRLDFTMTANFFFEHLYCHSPKAEQYLADICRRIDQESSKNIILYGYQGCGKTTFVHYMLQKLNCRSVLINFDAYVDNGNEIKHELVSHLYRSIMHDLTGRDGEDGMYPLDGRIGATAQMFCEVFNSHENKRIIEEKYDSWNDYVYFFEKLEYTKLLYTSTAEQLNMSWEDYETKKDRYPVTDLKVHMAQLDINQLMVAIILWDIAYTLAFGKRDQCCIVFESLDTIFNAAALPDFTKQIIYFRNNIDSILADLTYNGTSLAMMNRLYTLIFVMRETTKCEFVDHFVDSVEMYIPQQSMSFLYEYKDVVHRRNTYLHKLKSYRESRGEDIIRIQKLENELTQLENLMEDPYIKERMFGLFNRNFRVCTRILAEIAFMVPDTFSNAMRVKNSKRMDRWSSKYASRCILFRQFFNQFSMEGYFEFLRKSEYQFEVKRKQYSVDLSRYILLYLNNKQGITRRDEDKENQMVSLHEIFKDLLVICDDKKVLVNSLWNMYEMRKKPFWGHLITFDDMLTLDPNVLEQQLTWVTENKTDEKFGKVRITTAGVTYLDLLLPHFEYFAARHFKSYAKSFFAYSLNEFFETDSNQPEQPLVVALASVWVDVKECFYHLSKFYEASLKDVEEYAPENFLNSNFAWKKMSRNTGIITKMFHGDRLIHSHIGYLDTLRFYCFRVVDIAANHKQIDMNLDLCAPLQKVMRINGMEEYIPTIVQIYDDAIKHFCLHSPNRQLKNCADDLQEVECTYRDGNHVLQYIPVQEIAMLLKAYLNITIIDAIKQYIQLVKPELEGDFVAISNDSFYLVSCYMACICEKIEKKSYTDFETSICREIGDELLRTQLSDKVDNFTADDWFQWLEENGLWANS